MASASSFPRRLHAERIKFAIENDILPRVRAAQPEAPTALERLGRGFEDVRQGVKQVGQMLGEKAASLALGEIL